MHPIARRLCILCTVDDVVSAQTCRRHSQVHMCGTPNPARDVVMKDGCWCVIPSLRAVCGETLQQHGTQPRHEPLACEVIHKARDLARHPMRHMKTPTFVAPTPGLSCSCVFCVVLCCARRDKSHHFWCCCGFV